MSANATANGNGQAPVSAVARAGNSTGTSESDRRAMAYLSASRHSSRVRFLKFTLPMLAAIFIGAFYYYSRSDDVPLDKIELSAGSIENGKIVMANPVLKGFNSDNLPYRMTAERAIQDVGSRNLVALENIRASIPVDKSNTAIIGAETGTYNNARRTLKVNSPLTVATSDGMTAKLQSAFIEMKSGSLQTNKPVEIENKGSLIKANSMTVKDNGRVLVFEKNVQLTITPDQLKSAGDKQQKQEGGNAK